MAFSSTQRQLTGSQQTLGVAVMCCESSIQQQFAKQTCSPAGTNDHAHQAQRLFTPAFLTILSVTFKSPRLHASKVAATWLAEGLLALTGNSAACQIKRPASVGCYRQLVAGRSTAVCFARGLQPQKGPVAWTRRCFLMF